MGDTRRESTHVIFKATNDCNSNCEYCYDKYVREANRGKKMSLETLDRFAYLMSQHSKTVEILHHGGEPTMMPKQFYEDAMDIFCKYYNTEFIQLLQTNGIKLIQDSEWLELFSDLGIKYGVSFDMMYQKERIGADADDINDKYIKLLEYMNDINLTRDIQPLTVITSKNVTSMIDIYEYMKHIFDSRVCRLAFLYAHQNHEPLELRTLETPIPILDREMEKFYAHIIADESPYAVTEREHEQTLSVVWNVGSKANCHHGDCRNSRLGVHPDGTLLYCDAPFKKYPLKTVYDYGSIEELYKSPEYLAICNEIQERYDNECAKCDYLELCGGECHNLHKDFEGNFNKCYEYTCSAIKVKSLNAYFSIQGLEPSEIKNLAFKRMILNMHCILPYEIEQVLLVEGVEVNLRGIKRSLDFVTSPEYRLVRYFCTLTHGYHTDFMCKERVDYIREVYSEHKYAIDNLVREIGGKCAN